MDRSSNDYNIYLLLTLLIFIDFFDEVTISEMIYFNSSAISYEGTLSFNLFDIEELFSAMLDDETHCPSKC